jgi:hypothetical protein
MSRQWFVCVPVWSRHRPSLAVESASRHRKPGSGPVLPHIPRHLQRELDVDQHECGVAHCRTRCSLRSSFKPIARSRFRSSQANQVHSSMCTGLPPLRRLGGGISDHFIILAKRPRGWEWQSLPMRTCQGLTFSVTPERRGCWLDKNAYKTTSSQRLPGSFGCCLTPACDAPPSAHIQQPLTGRLTLFSELAGSANSQQAHDTLRNGAYLPSTTVSIKSSIRRSMTSHA